MRQWMKDNGFLTQAVLGMRGTCRVCHCCDGVACAGEVPGMGGLGDATVFRANRAALDAIPLRVVPKGSLPRTAEPTTTRVRLLGMELSLPVVAAPVAGVRYNMGGGMSEGQYFEHIVRGCSVAGTIAGFGDGLDPALFEAYAKTCIETLQRGIATIKPWADADLLISRIRIAERANALAICVDIDAAGMAGFANTGNAVERKGLRELAFIVESTELPVIVKGIMTPADASNAVAAGAKAIVVSNHGGRVSEEGLGSAEVLASLAHEFRGKVVILVDGGVRTGVDVLKMMALGADAVMVGRPFAIAAFGGGARGVAGYIEKLQSELESAMSEVGIATVAAAHRAIRD